jgi:hypothetical protein
MKRLAPVAIAAGIFSFAARPASGQIDYRNLDDGRPVATEDAYSIERFGFELLAPYRFEADHAGANSHVVAPELEYGLLPNTQVGIRTLLAAVKDAGTTDWGLAGLRVFGLYNFNTETAGLTALAMRAETAIPLGQLAGDAFGLTLEAIATRSWGATRAHINAAVRVGIDTDIGSVDAPPRWQVSGAIDHTFLRQSLLVIGELLTERETNGAPVEVNLSAGLRWQWEPTLVLDFGLTRRLASNGPDLGLTVGLSQAFAVRSLIPGADR